MRCGAVNCGRKATIAHLVAGGLSNIFLSCDDCREYFCRDRVPIALLVQSVPLEDLPVHEVMEESEIRETWDPGAFTGFVRKLRGQ